ncbi:hypothetical protein B4N89_22850 [Embleya scabrispora]|uniref:Uncharacterized protein n=1 Tax=Embleya scabrispora TaxID=159449 RepID=A0A1T3P360_9ACTN|nr:hypothetical protein B4N89_22850 [Embleya scabrispora]
MSNIERILDPRRIHRKMPAPHRRRRKPADQRYVPNPRPNNAPVPPGGFKVSPAGLRGRPVPASVRASFEGGC